LDNTMEQPEHNKKEVEYDYDWTAVKKLFKSKPNHIEFHVIGFTKTSAVDKTQLKVPKHTPGVNFLYTAAFFCKNEKNQWFIYRVIFVLTRKVTKKDMPKIYDKLAKGAYLQLVHHRRTKDPMAFIKDIPLLS